MATTTFQFADWPPTLSSTQLTALHIRATTWALSRGLSYLPVGHTDGPPNSAVHAPLSLFPSPFPRTLFKRAKDLQSVYNVLYARIAMDTQFLDQVMGAEKGVGRVDDFVGQLWRGWKSVRDNAPNTLHLGLFRSDYMLHNLPGEELALKQVEFNTISSSLGPLCERVAGLHRHLHSSTNYFGTCPSLSPDQFPPNNTTSELVQGLIAAHKVYNVPSSQILFVVQPGERNVFDQRWLEYELLESSSIGVIRLTFDQIGERASIDPATSALLISSPESEVTTEISIVYFRAGYTPTDFPTQTQYETRFLLERSRAIKCPSIPLQLAGGKKIQQVLSEPGVLERFLSDEIKYGADGVYSHEQIALLRTSWMDMWALDAGGSDNSGLTWANERHGSLVLKPQREGGGNNIYKEAIPKFLEQLPVVERQAWIAMELIVPPEGLQNYLVRADTSPLKMDVVSELGIFGWALFGGGQVLEEHEAGWLVRTKGKDSNEGGVATGFSVLDSVFLV